MTARGVLKFPAAMVAPPPDYGPLLDAAEVAERILRGKRSPQWVKRVMTSPEAGRVKLGHSTVLWYEHLARAWVAAHLST